MPNPIRPDEVPEGQENNLYVLQNQFRAVAEEIQRLAPGLTPAHDPHWLKDRLYELTRKIIARVTE